MSQATSDNSTVETLADAFQELESEIRDLTRMACLAVQQLARAVNDLSFKDGKYIELPDAEKTELAVFAVQKIHDMAKELEANYDRLWNEYADKYADKARAA